MLCYSISTFIFRNDSMFFLCTWYSLFQSQKPSPKDGWNKIIVVFDYVILYHKSFFSLFIKITVVLSYLFEEKSSCWENITLFRMAIFLQKQSGLIPVICKAFANFRIKNLILLELILMYSHCLGFWSRLRSVKHFLYFLLRIWSSAISQIIQHNKWLKVMFSTINASLIHLGASED